VVEQGSLSAAARRLKTPLTTVSRNVSELEAHLRTKLFNRSSRQLVLTDTGASYVAACKRILTDVTEAERTASGEYTAPTGELAVTTPLGLGRVILMPIIADFLKTYPDINVRMIPTDQKLSLAQEQMDVAVRIGELPDSSLRAVRVGQVRRMLVASPDYLATHGRPQHPQELAGHVLIQPTQVAPYPEWRFAEGAKPLVQRIRPRLRTTTNDATRSFALAGLGVARLISYQVADALASGALLPLLEDFELPPVPVHVVHHEGRHATQKVRAFVDLAVSTLRANPALR
jgi:DNA-binding transcriptional LysR family regulator